MKATLTIFLTVLFLCSCNENYLYTNLEKENKVLLQQVDSLKSIIRRSLDPIIINSGSWQLNEGDTAKFVVGLMYNDEKIMDSVQMSLFNINVSNNPKLIRTDLNLPINNIERTHGLAHFVLPNLEAGKYLYDGFVVIRDKRVNLQHFFEVYE